MTARPARTAAEAFAAFFTRTRFVYGEVAAIDVLAGQSLNRCLGSFRRRHGNKSKAAGTAAHPIHDEIDFGDWTKLGEKLLQIVLGSVEGKVPDIQFRVHDDFTVVPYYG